VYVLVTDPVKQGDGVGAYVSYKIQTKTTLEQYKRPVSEVIRRFRDFAWLHEKLVEKNKGVIVPPMPEKNAVQKFQMATDFIEQRRKALQVFINKVAAHPVLKYTRELQLFLEANEEEWALELAKAQGDLGSRLKLNTAVNWFKDVGQSATSLVSGRNDDALEDPEYLRIKEYIVSLESHLLEAHRQAQRLVRKEQDLGASMAEFGQAAERLGKFQQGSLPDAFAQLAYRANQIANATRERTEVLTNNFELPLKEFARTVKAVQTTIADRSSALSALQHARSEVDSKKVRLNRLRATPGSKEDKIADVERELAAAEQSVKDCKMMYETIVARMTEELNRFQRERAAEMTSVLRGFALTQAQLAHESGKSWSQLLLDLEGARA
jgi:sorting nexin-1/2